MNDEQRERMNEAIDAYSEWLTTWGQTDYVHHTFDRSMFYGKYGYADMLYDSEKAITYYRVMIFEVGYGDDGGNAFLTCSFDDPDWPEGVGGREPNELRFMTQEFDTLQQIIYDEGKLVKLP